MELIILIFSLPIIIYFVFQKHRANTKSLLPPGPPGLPIIGNLHQLDTSAPHVYLWKLSQKFGPLMSLKLGFVPTLVVSSAKMAKEVLKTHDLVFAGRPSFVATRKLSYDGLNMTFAPYGEYWREMRKTCVVHLFNTKRVQSFRSVREDEVFRMIKKIDKLASESSKVINLSEILVAFATTLTCRVAFSKRYDDEGCERSKFHSLLNEVQDLSTCFFAKDFFPLMGWVDKVTGASQWLERVFKELDEFFQEIIDDHLHPNWKKSEQEDFLDILLRLKDGRLFSIDLTWDHIKGVILDIFVAGTDTSAASTVWAMTALMKNPIAMKRIQEEIRNVIGKKGFVDEDDLQRLPYLKAVIKETMRLYPSVPLLVPHESIQACVIDGYEIPSKTLLYINGWAIGRDPESWEEPEQFLPERYLGSAIDLRGQNFELIPFGAGRRGCPGINMGIANVELALANLLYSFEWELPIGVTKEDIDTVTAPGTTMHKKNALCLLAKKILE